MALNTENQQKTYFPALDALRGLAFFAVFLGHAFIGELGSPDVAGSVPSANPMVYEYLKLGHLGLDFFFVLSGFLISWIILREWERKKSFHFGKFMGRRILRIWPLYFALVGSLFLLAQFLDGALIQTETIPHFGWFASFTLNFQLAENGSDFLFPLVILWSISVEEQFYLLWGVFGKWLKRALLPLALCLIVASILFRWWSFGERDLSYFHSLSVAGNFGIGFLAAWMAHKKLPVFDKIRRSKTLPRALIYIGLLVTLVLHPFIFNSAPAFAFERLLFSILFALIIIDQCFSEKAIIPLKKLKWLVNSGKMSYGLYGFHAIAVILVFHWAAKNEWESGFQLWLIVPICALALSYLMALMSWYFFEKPILGFKRFFR